MKKLQDKISYPSDEEIIEKLKDGESALFEVLIRRYNPLLYKIARSYGFTHHDAEDLMQESHVAAFTQLKTFRQDASYKTWLTRIHIHKCYHKGNYGYGKYEQPGNEFITDLNPYMQPSSNKQETEKLVVNRELAKLLETSLQQLPLPYRSVFVLREMEGFSVAETAELLDISPINVKVRMNRAKALLQKQLEHYYSRTDIFEFHLMYCDKIVRNVFEKLAATSPT